MFWPARYLKWSAFFFSHSDIVVAQHWDGLMASTSHVLTAQLAALWPGRRHSLSNGSPPYSPPHFSSQSRLSSLPSTDDVMQFGLLGAAKQRNRPLSPPWLATGLSITQRKRDRDRPWEMPSATTVYYWLYWGLASTITVFYWLYWELFSITTL